jgi:hypothetical protein
MAPVLLGCDPAGEPPLPLVSLCLYTTLTLLHRVLVGLTSFLGVLVPAGL